MKVKSIVAAAHQKMTEEVLGRMGEVSWESLPQVKVESWTPSNNQLIIYYIGDFRQEASRFVYEMISRWLVPGKRVVVSTFFASDFAFKEEEGSFTLCEFRIDLDSIEGLDGIRRNFTRLAEEICLGATSAYHARRILELKGVTLDEKLLLVHERINELLHRFVNLFDYDMISLMQHFLTLSHREFKMMRTVSHLSRIVYTTYVMQNQLKQRVENDREKRHIALRLARTKLHLPFGYKSVLGIFVCLNILQEGEVFEKKQLVRAIKKGINGVRIVKDSYFMSCVPDEDIYAFYVEVEKEAFAEFSQESIPEIKKQLKRRLLGAVEHVMRPVFMPRNEEETMKSIVLLSHQLRLIRDAPQVMIRFDGYSHQKLGFTVVILRLLLNRTPELEQLLGKDHPFTVEKVKQVGFLRKKYPKEAIVLRVEPPIGDFLREDQSIDFNRARQYVLGEVEKRFSRVRDFNGGMISKQLEYLKQLHHELLDRGYTNGLRIENFFYAVKPIERRAVVKLEKMIAFYVLYEALSQEEGPEDEFLMKKDVVGKSQLIVCRAAKEAVIVAIEERFAEEGISERDYYTFKLSEEGSFYIGYIFPLEATLY
ncbi:MAG: hypothetical protein S4CHLAM102_07970 [Chlamydiia bacterium]|nr:hypothetical protein [Chlamydiia bacterium]